MHLADHGGLPQLPSILLALWEGYCPVGAWAPHVCDRFAHSHEPKAGPLARMSLCSHHSNISQLHEYVMRAVKHGPVLRWVPCLVRSQLLPS